MIDVSSALNWSQNSQARGTSGRSRQERVPLNDRPRNQGADQPDIAENTSEKSPASRSFESSFAEAMSDGADQRSSEKLPAGKESLAFNHSKKADPLMRRVAMQKFLQKMEEDLGVDAVTIMGAFSRLSNEDLISPPEQSVDKIIDQLDLDEKQKLKAMALFQDLLKQTSSPNVGDYLDNNGDQQISLRVFSESEARKRALNASLDKMSQSFFVDNRAIKMQQQQKDSDSDGMYLGSSAGSSPLSPWTANGPNNLNETSLIGKNVSIADSGMNFPESLPNGLGEVGANSALQVPSSIGGEESILSDDGVESITQKENDPRVQGDSSAGLPQFPKVSGSEISSHLLRAGNEGRVTQANYGPPGQTVLSQQASVLGAHQIGSDSINPISSGEESSDLEGILSQAEIKSAADATGKSSLNEFRHGVKAYGTGSGSGHQKASSDGNGFDHSSQGEALGLDSDLSTQASLSVDQQKTHEVKSTPFSVGAPKMTDTQASANMREVVDQAQVLVKSGGGEMKIKLNPEGVGEVTLKVVTDGGRVNVEMMASNSETKKMLERGLADLRDTFSSHRLQLEQIKVGSPESMSRHLDQQMPDQQQRMAHHFMEEFRQNNQNWRQGFVDLPGIKTYRSQTQEEHPEVDSSSRTKRAKGNGHRLNLVA